MIITIHATNHTVTIGDVGDGNLFIGFDDDDEAYTFTKVEAATLMETLKMLLYKQ